VANLEYLKKEHDVRYWILEATERS
jgi:hypothetical protein